MATILQQYREKQQSFCSQNNSGNLPLEKVIEMQEVNYRICVLETFESFCKTAPITTDNKAMGYHYQLVDAYVRFESRPQAVLGAQEIECSGAISLETVTFAEQGLCMVTELELGERKEPDPGRPSLILRHVGENRLWDIAKECGSTVSAICEANQLQQEPESDRMLLIPVS